jgi:flagellar motor switch protein FliM
MPSAPSTEAVTGNAAATQPRASASAAQAPRIAPRRFDRPLRLSASDLATLKKAVDKILPEVARELSVLLRAPPRIALTELVEIDADDLRGALAPPLATLRFEVGGQPGWFVWDCAAALGALEVALGAPTTAKSTARELTTIERAMFLRLMSNPVTTLARALGPETTKFTFAANAETFGNWRQGGERAEPRRLQASFEFGPAEAASTWKLCLPGVTGGAKSPEPPRINVLPAHLSDVSIDVVARLGSGEVALSDLLALEPGDVIPLQHALGEPLQIVIDDRACMRGMLGRTQGKLGVRITGAIPKEPVA